MYLYIDLTGAIIESLKGDGYGSAGKRTIRGVGGVEIMGRDGEIIAVPGVLRPPRSQQPIDDLFKGIINMLEEVKNIHGKYPSQIIFQGGGTIPMPDWFLAWLREHGITIRIVGPEDIDDNGDLRIR